GGADVVLRGDQLDAGKLASLLARDDRRDLWVGGLQVRIKAHRTLPVESRRCDGRTALRLPRRGGRVAWWARGGRAAQRRRAPSGGSIPSHASSGRRMRG